MPATILGREVEKRKRPKTNIFIAIYRQMMFEQKLNTVSLGKILGVTGKTAAAQLRKPVQEWKIKDIVNYCKAIKWDLKDALEAVRKSI